MKKLFAILFVVLTVGVFLGGCAPKQDKAAEPPPAEQGQ
jgi:hypothetical protein